MRHFILAFAVFVVVFCFVNVPFFAYALSLDDMISSFSSMAMTPFGGKITSTTKAQVTCMSGTGPISMQSATKDGNGKEYLAQHGGNKTSGQVTTNQYWLGLSQTQSPQCLQGVEPYQTPYTVTPTNFYGVSGGK
jgi:hypothetical protein